MVRVRVSKRVNEPLPPPMMMLRYKHPREDGDCPQESPKLTPNPPSTHHSLTQHLRAWILALS